MFAWREPGEVLFCEVKVGPDRIRANRRRFLDNALWLRPLSEFLIIEMPRAIPAEDVPDQPTTLCALELLISPRGVAHFPGCPHKGSHPDYTRWATLSLPWAWERLGNGEELQATGGQRPGLVARSPCPDCVRHGPW